MRQRLSRITGILSRLKESYRELYHNSPVMYFRLDVNGRLIAFNDTLMRTLGRRREELSGQSYTDLLEPVPGRAVDVPLGQPPFEEGQVETRGARRRARCSTCGSAPWPTATRRGTSSATAAPPLT